jgi:hypothetical protein
MVGLGFKSCCSHIFLDVFLLVLSPSDVLIKIGFACIYS